MSDERFKKLCAQAEGGHSDSWELGVASTTLGQPQVVVASFDQCHTAAILKGFILLTNELEWRVFTRGVIEAGQKNGWRLSGSLDARS